MTPDEADAYKARRQTQDLYNANVNMDIQTDPLGMPIESSQNAAMDKMFQQGEAPQTFDAPAYDKAIAQQSILEQAAQKDAQEKQIAAQAQIDKIQAENQTRLAAGLPPLPLPPGTPSPVAAAPQGEAPSGLAEAAPQPSATPAEDSTMAMMQRGFGKQVAGLQAQADAQGKLGQEQAAQYEEARKSDEIALKK
jgi:hypothetical protein